MPELPEVETTRRGIAPWLVQRKVAGVIVRDPRLRWPVPGDLDLRLRDAPVHGVERRGKYLLFRIGDGTLLVHLGMSGSLRLMTEDIAPRTHDHVDLLLDNGHRLRYTDPRRFGAWLWTEGNAVDHPLLRSLGPEPLTDAFSGDYLFAHSRGRRGEIKSFLMDGHTVVGVGNIYATEALFRAGIHPLRPAGRIALLRYRRLAEQVRTVLSEAIARGGTTLRDFVDSRGQPGYFALDLLAYGRAGQPCTVCGSILKSSRLNQRATAYCGRCQR